MDNFIKGKIIEEYKYKKHHMLINGQIDPVSVYIDCWDQILYTILVNNNVDIIKYFYGNINAEYYEDSDRCGLKRIEENVNRDFEIKPIDASKQLRFVEVEKIFNNNIPISMITMFDMLPNYDWYKKDTQGTHNGHSNLIVGYDDYYLYAIDSPLVFVKERDKTANFNETIHLIEKSYIADALQLYCDLRQIIYLNTTSYDPLEKIIQNIVADFNSNGFKGRNALIKYIDIIKNNNNNKNITLIYYDIHLIYSRHILLKMYITEKVSDNSKWKYILPYLEVTIANWFSLKMFISRSVKMNKTTYISRVHALLNIILENEEKLVKTMHYLL